MNLFRCVNNSDIFKLKEFILLGLLINSVPFFGRFEGKKGTELIFRPNIMFEEYLRIFSSSTK